jgi:hypothetical protein
MSLEALLGEDRITVQTPSAGQDGSAGMRRTPFVDLYSGVPARINDVSSSQRLQYAQLQITVTDNVYVQQPGIGNGMMIVTSDGRRLRVNGIQKLRALGGLDTFYKLLCEEVRPGT